MTYIIRGLPLDRFAGLFTMSDVELAARGARRVVADDHGYPCRVSLVDAEPGESLILLNHVSHDVANPYRASHAIFVADAAQAEYVDEVPPVFVHRILSLRGFDKDGMMADALVTQPGEADTGIRKLFDNPAIETIHVHNAARGCFSAKVERA
jgi:hypothetical protein